MEKVVSELSKANAKSHQTALDLRNFQEKANYTFDAIDFASDEKKRNISTLDEKINAVEIDLKGKISQVNFELQRRVRIDDMN